MPEETPEAKAKRLERRKAHIEQQKRSKISHLSGLSDMELEAIQAARNQGSSRSKESFIFSDGDISPDKRNYCFNHTFLSIVKSLFVLIYHSVLFDFLQKAPKGVCRSPPSADN